MAIEFDCPHCTASIRVGDSSAGKVGKCPQCKEKIRVPQPQGRHPKDNTQSQRRRTKASDQAKRNKAPRPTNQGESPTDRNRQRVAPVAPPQVQIEQPQVVTALLACPHCNHGVSPRAESCPNCGCPFQSAVVDTSVSTSLKNRRKKVSVGKLAFAIISPLVIVVLLLAVGKKLGLTEAVPELDKAIDAVEDRAMAIVDPASSVETAEKSVVLVRTRKGTGTGFVVGDGLVATNFHVVKGGREVELQQGDKTWVCNAAAFADQSRDLVILKVPELGLPAMPIRDSQPKKGDTVIVLGNPKGLASTVTQGVISGFRSGEDLNELDRTKQLAGEWIQIDAAVNSGNSGGPVFDQNGNVVGVATSSLTNSENINFALSYADLKRALVSQSNVDFATITGGSRSRSESPQESKVAAKPFSLKGDQLGMSLEAFKTRHRRRFNVGKQYEAPFCSDQRSKREREASPISTLFEADWHPRGGIINARLTYPFEDRKENTHTPTLAGTKVKIHIYEFVDGRMFGIRYYFPRDGFSRALVALVETYGDPARTEEREYQNGFGAKFIGKVCSWDNGVSTIALAERSFDLKTSSLRFEHKELSGTVEARRSALDRPEL